MTENTDKSEAAIEAHVNQSGAGGMAMAAVFLALLAVIIAAAGVAAPYIPALQRYLPAQATAPDLTGEVGALQQQVRRLAEAQSAPVSNAPEIDITPLTARLDKVEQQILAADGALAEAQAKANEGAVKPAALAFMRVETRLLRGEPFAAELGLLRTAAQLTPEQDRDLTAAATGVKPVDGLIDDLRKHERAARREARLATVQNPLDRVWAEIQSLVLIKDASMPARPDDAFDALLSAVRQGNKAVTEAAWQAVPEAAKKVLYPAYGEVERRQRAELALQQLAPAALAVR